MSYVCSRPPMSATASNNLAPTGKAEEEKSRKSGSAVAESLVADSDSDAESGEYNVTQLPSWSANKNPTPTRRSMALACPKVVDVSSIADMRGVIARLEELQAHPGLKSPQQPAASKRYIQQRKTGVDAKGSMFTPLDQHDSLTEIDILIGQALRDHPEQRQRMASMTRSGWLRQKILSYQPQGARGAGSITLGSSHCWRHEKLPLHFTDHNWPRVALGSPGSQSPGPHLPGGDHRHARVLRCSADQLARNPAYDQPPNHSFSKDKRWWGSKDDGQVDRKFHVNRGNPGPGSYMKSVPRGGHFHTDGGETVVLGANHPCPWKSPLGQHINPSHVHVHSEHHSAAKWSFSKTRRTCSEPFLGHGGGGAVKTDEGCLSPGHVYEFYSTFSPGQKQKSRRRVRSISGSPSKMRCYPVPPEPDTGDAVSEDFDEFGSPCGY